MGSLGGAEILVILVVALLVLGPERLPDAARQVGRVMAELRRMSSGFQAEIRDAMQTPVAGPSVPPPPAPSPPPPPAPQEQKFLWSDLPTSADEPGS